MRRRLRRRTAALLALSVALAGGSASTAAARSDSSWDPTGVVSMAFRGNQAVHPPPRHSALAPGTDLPYTMTQQVMIADRTSGSRGTWARYEWQGPERGWVQVNLPATSRFGYGGVRQGDQRSEGDGSTPAGTYPILFTFGPADPGARMPYRTVTPCSYWVGDVRAADYNRWRESCSGPVAGERLADFTSDLYRQAPVIGFNQNQVRTGPGSGSAIFLHYATASTAGCVGLDSSAELTATIRWLDPAKAPVIVIRP